jgi:serine/threonine protein kinase
MVYRGILSNGQVVAIKRINSAPFSKNHFLSELHILGQLRHRNLLKILGYFHNGQEMILLSKFMTNLSLHILLHGPQDCRLNWRQRLKIAMGVAFGLEYLHHGLRNAIVHGDLKPANILLDEHLEPHIADFGLAQVISNNQRTQSSLGPPFAFTVGYTAPGTEKKYGFVSSL